MQLFCTLSSSLSVLISYLIAVKLNGCVFPFWQGERGETGETGLRGDTGPEVRSLIILYNLHWWH